MAGILPNIHGNFRLTPHIVEHVRIGICVSEWNTEITKSLLEACVNCLEHYKIPRSNIEIEFVPGSYELPLLAQKYLQTDYDGVICLGCIIKGETIHDAVIAQAVSNGIMELNLKFNKPVIFGVLTTNTVEQAQERSGGKLGNKGEESALCLLKMIQILH